MASGNSAFSKNYDKILLVVALALLCGAVAFWFSARGAAADVRSRCDRELASRKPVNPEVDMAAVGKRLSAFSLSMGLMEHPFEMVVNEGTKEGFFIPEIRVWCVKCRKPIPFSAEKCPLCGESQPSKKAKELDPNMDSDGDGLPDLWERKYGFNPLDKGDAQLDFDGDGFSNAEEYAAKTDPVDSKSHPDMVGYLRVASIETARLPLVFKATNHMGNNNYKCQFNYVDKELGNRQKTLFVKVGDVIGPLDRLPGMSMNAPARMTDFRLADLEWHEENVFNKIENREKTVKVPVAIVERVSSGRRIEFRIDKESNDAIYTVTLVQTRDGTEIVADGGEGEAEFELDNAAYVISKVDKAKGTVSIVRKTDGTEISVPGMEK